MSTELCGPLRKTNNAEEFIIKMKISNKFHFYLVSDRERQKNMIALLWWIFQESIFRGYTGQVRNQDQICKISSLRNLRFSRNQIFAIFREILAKCPEIQYDVRKFCEISRNLISIRYYCQWLLFFFF